MLWVVLRPLVCDFYCMVLLPMGLLFLLDFGFDLLCKLCYELLLCRLGVLWDLLY